MPAPQNYLSTALNLQAADPVEEGYDLLDFPKIRQLTTKAVVEGLSKRFPIANDRHTLSLTDVEAEEKPFSIKEQKQAIMEGRSLANKIKGKWALTDNATGQVVSKTNKKIVMTLPWLTDRGTYIRNGHEYTLSHVMRLRPGVYSRMKANGLAEAQINVEQGTGVGMKLELDPDTGTLNLRKGGRAVKLAGLLRGMGVPREEMDKAWGKELSDANDKASQRDESKTYELFANDVPGMPKQAAYESQLSVERLRKNYPWLADDEVHRWRAENNIELIHKEPDEAEQDRIWANWQQMSDEQKALSETKSMALFKLSNALHHAKIKKEYWSGMPKQAADETEAAMPPGQAVNPLIVPQPELKDRLLAAFGRSKVDPDSTSITLGVRHENVTPKLLLSASAKLLRLARGEAEADERDSLEFQRVHGHPELFAERVMKDGGGVARKLLWKATNKGGLDFMPAGPLNDHVDSLFEGSSLAQYIEGSSPVDMIDNATKITRLGEGGLGDIRAAPAHSGARAVHNSYAGFIDPVRTAESLKVGLDAYAARGIRKGSDGLLYNKYINARTGKEEWVSSRRLALSKLAMPDQWANGDDYMPVLSGAKGVDIAHRKDVDFVMRDASDQFSYGTSLVPGKAGVKGLRLNMGGKYASQSLPLFEREAPFVSTADRDGKAIEEGFGALLGARRAKDSGVVEAVTKDGIKVRYLDGSKDEIELYDNFPANQKGFMRSEAQVKPGDVFKKGSVLASSNYTDKEGRAALGRNLRVAWIAWRGNNYEDGVALTEAAAKKLAHETLVKSKVPVDKEIQTDPERYKAFFPGRFDEGQFKNIGKDGLAKPGTVLSKGDPVILSFKENAPSVGTLGRRTHTDHAEVWEHEYPGEVVEGAHGKDKRQVLIKAVVPMRLGDKVANRYGGKGVVSLILPDAEAPLDAEGKPYEIFMSPQGIITRTNPQAMIETALGKVAERTGRRYAIPDFRDDHPVDYAQKELASAGLSDTEDLVDPATGRTIPKILTGNAFFYKLKHIAEGKESGRGEAGGYTGEEIPGGKGYEGAKRLAGMEQSALVSHGAWEAIKDARVLRGQSNDNFWSDLKMGRTPAMPATPLTRDKFFNHLRGSGIHVKESPTDVSIFGMTGKQAREMAGGREVRNGSTFDDKKFQPIKDGLFDPGVFGKDGNSWGYLRLDEPIPNPVMEDTLRRALNLGMGEYDEIVSGRKELSGLTGGAAIKAALDKVDLDFEINSTRRSIGEGKGQRRDDAIKRLRALRSLKEQGVEPKDFMMDVVPVLPPKFRSIQQNAGMTMAADSNYLYKDLIAARDDLAAAKGTLPDDMLADARARVYSSYKALTGLEEPKDEKLQSKGVKGLLKWVFGDSPKTGAAQRKVFGGSVNMVGRGTIVSDPSLTIDQVGIPENQAWSIYEPFVVRELIQGGYPATDAVKMVAEKKPAAYEALKKAVKARPVMLNRAPSLHKFSVMGFEPVLMKGGTIRLNPNIITPFNADFDGDNMNFHVPVSMRAAAEIREKMLPSRNLLSVRSFKAHYLPIREYGQGLYLASRQAPGKPTKSFDSVDSLRRAYQQGMVDVDEPVRLNEKRT